MPSRPGRTVKLAPSVLLPKHLFAAIRHQQPPIRVAPIVVESAALAPEIVHRSILKTRSALRHKDLRASPV